VRFGDAAVRTPCEDSSGRRDPVTLLMARPARLAKPPVAWPRPAPLLFAVFQLPFATMALLSVLSGNPAENERLPRRDTTRASWFDPPRRAVVDFM
jgi:hypothetical protein